MKSMTIACSLLIALLAIGCGSGDDAGVVDAASEAAESVKTAAEDAATEAADTVKKSPAALCLELAGAKNWKDALEPCTAAAKEMPDDLSIKHALQQAQAAAEG